MFVFRKLELRIFHADFYLSDKIFKKTEKLPFLQKRLKLKLKFNELRILQAKRQQDTRHMA
jgi:hypothetical protein